MRASLRSLSHSSLALLFSVSVTSCTQSTPPATVAELADALQSEGLGYTSTQPIKMPSGGPLRFDEGIALVSDTLWVELIRIDDERTFKLAKDASAILAIAEATAGREFPGNATVHARQPFLIVMRQEPAAGHVLGALDRVMP